MTPFHKFTKRFFELAGISQDNSYTIMVTFEFDGLLMESESIKKFEKTTNRYFFHAEKSHPPVKAHYHIIPNNGKKELYAVNIDGTAHHKKNKGHTIPEKEALELRKLGVQIPDNNIIEYFVMTVENMSLILENKTPEKKLYILID